MAAISRPKSVFVALLACLTLSYQFIGSAQAKGPPKATEVQLRITQANGKATLAPNALRFERGQFYKLLITNTTKKSRYFTAAGLASRVFSRKVEVLGSNGKMIAEVHGQANNLELSPGAQVAWYFFPMINGKQIAMESKRRDNPPAQGSIEIFGRAPIIKK